MELHPLRKTTFINAPPLFALAQLSHKCKEISRQQDRMDFEGSSGPLHRLLDLCLSDTFRMYCINVMQRQAVQTIAHPRPPFQLKVFLP